MSGADPAAVTEKEAGLFAQAVCGEGSTVMDGAELRVSSTVLLVALPASLLLAQVNQWVFADIENQVVTKIGEREGLRIRRDEAGNHLQLRQRGC